MWRISGKYIVDEIKGNFEEILKKFVVISENFLSDEIFDTRIPSRIYNIGRLNGTSFGAGATIFPRPTLSGP